LRYPQTYPQKPLERDVSLGADMIATRVIHPLDSPATAASGTNPGTVLQIWSLEKDLSSGFAPGPRHPRQAQGQKNQDRRHI
jgi:hypothetical protein